MIDSSHRATNIAPELGGGPVCSSVRLAFGIGKSGSVFLSARLIMPKGQVGSRGCALVWKRPGRLLGLRSHAQFACFTSHFGPACHFDLDVLEPFLPPTSIEDAPSQSPRPSLVCTVQLVHSAGGTCRRLQILDATCTERRSHSSQPSGPRGPAKSGQWYRIRD